MAKQVLGEGALDEVIIPFCRENKLVWVTKDWSAGVADVLVTQLRSEGVSVWWLREESKKQMQRPELLWVAARDIDTASFQFDTAQKPIYIVSSVGRRAREIRLPFSSRRSTPPLPRVPRPRSGPTRVIPGGTKLFQDL